MLINHFLMPQGLGPFEHASLLHQVIGGRVDGDCQKKTNVFPGSHIVTGVTAVHILCASDPEATNWLPQLQQNSRGGRELLLLPSPSSPSSSSASQFLTSSLTPPCAFESVSTVSRQTLI